MLRLRQYYDRIGIGTADNWHSGQKMPAWRAYYSTRNMAYMLLYRERNILGLMALISRVICKVLIKLYYKPSLGYKEYRLQLKALYHGISCKLGQVVRPAR